MRICINNAYSSFRALNYLVPRGSVTGANLFMAYCALIEYVIPAGITINGFTDDHSV